MSGKIDIPRFKQSTGELSLLALVGAAFIRQLPQWRADFCVQAEAHNSGTVASLLHKMKGSCYAVAAYGAADAFEQAEHTLQRSERDGWQLETSGLLDLLDQIEKELQLIVAGPAV